MQSFEPWKSYPSLILERLITLAKAIQTARNSVVVLYDPENGDNKWSIFGCRAYARQCYALRRLKNEVNWLEVSSDHRENLELTISVGTIPLKIFRGDPQEASNRHTEFSRSEQILMASLMQQLPPGPLRLVVSTSAEGQVSGVSLVEFDNQEPMRAFDIPLDEDNGETFIIPEPDPLNPPPVQPHDDEGASKDSAFSG
jgi:hypothetical protein